MFASNYWKRYILSFCLFYLLFHRCHVLFRKSFLLIPLGLVSHSGNRPTGCRMLSVMSDLRFCLRKRKHESVILNPLCTRWNGRWIFICWKRPFQLWSNCMCEWVMGDFVCIRDIFHIFLLFNVFQPKSSGLTAHLSNPIVACRLSPCVQMLLKSVKKNCSRKKKRNSWTCCANYHWYIVPRCRCIKVKLRYPKKGDVPQCVWTGFFSLLTRQVLVGFFWRLLQETPGSRRQTDGKTSYLSEDSRAIVS